MKRAIVAAFAAVATSAALLAPGGTATGAITTAYDSTEVAPNVPSLGFEALSASEIGDEITFAAGASTRLSTITVEMSSWACQQGSVGAGNCATVDKGATTTVPITLNLSMPSVPGPDGTVVPGARLGSYTLPIAVPFRPGANLDKCPGGQWYDKKTRDCYDGKAFTVAWKLKPFRLSVPTGDLVVGVSFNTTHHGYAPIGEDAACYSTSAGCAYDSLHIGLTSSPASPTTGTQTTPDTIFWNTSYAGFYCDETPKVDVFNQDSPTDPCWTTPSNVPAFKVVTY